MKNKSILIAVKDMEQLENYIRMLKNGKFDDEEKYSKEVRSMIEEFMENDWKVYLGTLDKFDTEKGIFYNIYCINTQETNDLGIKEINDEISVMIIRNVGSVEQKFVEIETCLKYLINNYTGKVINDPKSMLRGMTKRYLVEINEKELEKFGVTTIPTKIFDRTITFEEICKQYPEHREDYLIKPVTGELSNSLKCLADVDEQFFRWKENKVGGWVVQPIQKEIWKGEYQISLLNKQVIYSQKKEYTNTDESVPSQKTRIISKYSPSDKEVSSAVKLVEYFEKLYDLKIDICRVDFMKTADGKMKLLEFEMVNPGFFIGYMKEHDLAIKKITKSIREYCERKLEA